MNNDKKKLQNSYRFWFHSDEYRCLLGSDIYYNSSRIFHFISIRSFGTRTYLYIILDLSLDHSSWYLIWMERAPEYVCKVCGNTLSPQEGYQVWNKHSAFPKNGKNLFVKFYKPTEEFIPTQRTHYWSLQRNWTFPWSTCDCRMQLMTRRIW